MVQDFLSANVYVMLGNGDGTFQQAVYYDTNFPTSVLAQDLDGDGKIDLAASAYGPPPQIQSGVSVFKGNGDGTFQSGVFYPAGRQINYVAAGDFNRDGKIDVSARSTRSEISSLPC